MPPSFRYRGRDIDTDRFLNLHQEVEKTLIDQCSLLYLHVHQIATRAEQAPCGQRESIGATMIDSCRNT